MKNQQLINFLDSHESAPSACVLARTFYYNLNVLPSAEADLIYERSEADNDEERDQLISLMTSDQLNNFYELVVELMLEKLENI